MRKQLGLTMIELLVVILIIALIATLGAIAFKNARAKSRDAKRVYDIQQYAKALRIYAHENGGEFPPDNGYLGRDPGASPNTDIASYLPELPADAQDGGTGDSDKYYYYVAANNCNGKTYPTVHVQTMETSNDLYYQNNCTGGSSEGHANVSDYLIIID